MTASVQVQILKYTLLPGFLPRLYQLFTSGFSTIPFLIASIYQSVGILPQDHPYANPANIGRFGIRHVVAAAANRLVFDKKHLDQVFIFCVILTGLALLAMQCVLLLVALIAHQPALAALIPSWDILTLNSVYNPYGPSQDLAFILLDRVFGIRDIFESCISTGATCYDLHGGRLPAFGTYPTPFHLAMHALFRFYSLGIFVVSVFVIIYFVTTIVGETAASGTPFGKRYNKVWVPVRLILFFALLVPLNTGGRDYGGGTGINAGMNGAQIITFWTAKLGSNLATNAWGRFNSVLTGTYLGQTTTLVAAPNIPKVNELLQFMFTVKTCQIAENYAYGHLDTHKPNGVQAYLVREKQANPRLPGPDAIDFRSTAFNVATQFTNYGNITVRFGVLNQQQYIDQKGGVKPLCGDVTVQVTDFEANGAPTTGSTTAQVLYYNLIKLMWNDTTLASYAACLRDRTMQDGGNPHCTNVPSNAFVGERVLFYQQLVEANLQQMLQQQANNGNWAVPPELRAKGWAGAAIWYNKIAEINGDLTGALFSLPIPTRMPYVMDIVAEQRSANNENVGGQDLFNPEAAKGLPIDYPRFKDHEIAPVLNTAYSIWRTNANYSDQYSNNSQNIILGTINQMFGTQGIFTMRCNPNIHPLAQLSTIGKGMMYAAIRNFAAGATISTLSSFVDNAGGNIAKMLGDFMHNVSFTTMAMSFILYYVLPFLPFIYFFFAVGGWLKSIFEAVVAMPLWALAHIRIDGNGIPPQGAMNGYYLLMEIFLRPVLIVFGLLASIQIFSALVWVMNNSFDLIVANVSGFDAEAELAGACSGGAPAPTSSQLENWRGAIDQFFFTAMYVILCYMMGLGCFKMIDYVPSNILRWVGSGASPLQEGGEAAATELLGKTYQGASLMVDKAKGGQLALLLSK